MLETEGQLDGVDPSFNFIVGTQNGPKRSFRTEALAEIFLSFRQAPRVTCFSRALEALKTNRLGTSEKGG